MGNRQTEKSMPDKWVDYIKKHIYKEFWAELRTLISKIDDINSNSKAAEIVLLLARKKCYLDIKDILGMQWNWCTQMSLYVSGSEMQDVGGGQEWSQMLPKSFPHVCHTQSLHLAAVGEAAIWGRVNLIPLNCTRTNLSSEMSPTLCVLGIALLALFELYREWKVRNSNEELKAVISWAKYFFAK